MTIVICNARGDMDENEFGGSCRTQGNARNSQKVLIVKLKRPLEHLGLDERLVLKWVSNSIGGCRVDSSGSRVTRLLAGPYDNSHEPLIP
jgi:hypothetical protein